MVYKFLQHVPNGNKVYEKLTETIKTNITEQDMTAVFDEVQNKVSSYSSNIKVKEEVFVANGEGNIPKMIADLQDQINNLRSNYHGITADGNPEESNNNVEDKDEDDQVYLEEIDRRLSKECPARYVEKLIIWQQTVTTEDVSTAREKAITQQNVLHFRKGPVFCQRRSPDDYMMAVR